jgi:hypothetical protein
MARLPEEEMHEGSVVVERDVRIPTRDGGFVRDTGFGSTSPTPTPPHSTHHGPTTTAPAWDPTPTTMSRPGPVA